jgi:hypothetical protein
MTRLIIAANLPTIVCTVGATVCAVRGLHWGYFAALLALGLLMGQSVTGTVTK